MLWTRGLHRAHAGSPALRDLSLAVREGEILAVTGGRGSGRTTLLDCLSGRLPPDRGEVWFNSIPLHALRSPALARLRRERFGWIGDRAQLVPELTARENAALPLLLAGAGARAARRTAQQWLERLDVGHCAHLRPGALDRAQRQRVAVARALVHRPAVLFADEPTAPLHGQERRVVLRTLVTAARSHAITMLLACNDPQAVELADRGLTLCDGRLACSLTA
ncbi:ABC transporter ATP-binding protein [Streptomyces aidingensis]|uniref:ABC transporter ATP-binding protein n=1 Tax=Streptomyces aidingensis TaxID=910347 RepID=UPI000B86F35D|nr:ATP-binding cassette domain-containing protein [Streptomyces aidingensis]